MTWHPPRVVPPIAILAVLSLACAHSHSDGQAQAAPAPIQDPTAKTVESPPPAQSLEQMLQGKISGVRVAALPGGGISVQIRGPTSFQSGEEPLYIVDGVAVQAGPNGALAWLNPKDIASIAVLKDAAAAIYGMRGSNGVIVIKTVGSH